MRLTRCNIIKNESFLYKLKFLGIINIDFSNVPLAPIATVMAALITALISFVNLTLSKEQKTSEFRQAWIDGLQKVAWQNLTNHNDSVQFLVNSE